jgi:hypothetical protein
MYLLTESAFEDFEGIPTNDPNAVVVGLAPEQFNYERYGVGAGAACAVQYNVCRTSAQTADRSKRRIA